MLLVGAQGQRMVAIGTEQGVWMGTEGSSSLTKVLNTASITQLAVLQDYHILLVLAGMYKSWKVIGVYANLI